MDDLESELCLCETGQLGLRFAPGCPQIPPPLVFLEPSLTLCGSVWIVCCGGWRDRGLAVVICQCPSPEPSPITHVWWVQSFWKVTNHI